MRSTPSLVAIAILSWLVASVAAAQLDVDRAEGGWRELVDPSRRLGLSYRQDGLYRLVRAMGTDDPGLGDAPPWVLLDQALLRFERARRSLPDDVELAYYTASALTLYEHRMPDGSVERRVDEALDAWHRVRQLDPSFFPDRVASSLASLHMQRHEFAEARAEYEAALGATVPETVDLLGRFYLPAQVELRLAQLFTSLDAASVHGNLAEAAMLTGDVPAAIEHYRAAIAQSQAPLTRALAEWGLAVALDRAGEHGEAVAVARRAIRDDPVSGDPRYQAVVDEHRELAVLHIEFFEPRWEIHAYEALGHEALARPDDGPGNAEELRLALRSWRLFLADGGVASRYAPIARQHIAELEREGVTVPPDPPRPRTPHAPRLPL